MSLLPVGIGSAEAGGYQIERSLRFNSADSAYLTRTLTTPTNNQKWTMSLWVKRCSFGSNQFILQAGDSSNEEAQWYFTTGDKIRFYNYSGSDYQYDYETVQVFRDPSAWYHFVVAYDSTQATAANRFKVYVNGSEITLTRTDDVTLNATNSKVNSAVSHDIGGSNLEARWSNQYLTEINFIDGQALTPSSFGETDTDTGVWKPKAYSGSYGTNGFYLKFADNSGTTSTTLGKDSSGNGNNWTPNNFSVTAGAGNDSLVDTPTNYGTDTGVGGEVRGNYATLNPLNINSGTISNGNLNQLFASASYQTAIATFGMSSGKWYCEITCTAIGGTGDGVIGIAATQPSSTFVGNTATSYGWYSKGEKYNNGTGVSYNSGSTWTTNSVIGIAFDADAGTLTFYKDGVSQGSAYTSIPAGTYFVAVSSYSSTAYACNFGQRPFAYTAPSGFKALCTQNLPEPVIKDGGDYFNTILYTGTGSSNARTGVGFQPDFVWIKGRSGATDHGLYDAVRGVQKQLESNTTTAETTETTGLTAFGSDGFTVGALAQLNTSSATYVAWNWKANGAGSSNTAGTITSTVSVNTTSGFSIVTYTGTGSNATVGHGLGVAPSMIIIKRRSSVDSWLVYSASLGATNYLVLNTTDASGTSSAAWNNTSPTSSVFSVGTSSAVNGSSETYVAYCFAPVSGYSAFGSYTGNGSADGPFVYTGFRPAFVMWKGSTSVTNWYIEDDLRAPYNPGNAVLRPNTSEAELSSGTGAIIDFLSNGFKLRNNGTEHNGSGETYIYAAFAENAFKVALAR